MARERIIGTYDQGQKGPLLLFLGGIHGNEPAGVYALERVFKRLDELKPAFIGKVIGLCGNCAALAKGKRYIDKDLNRLWSKNEIERVKTLAEEDRNQEERELLALLLLMEPAFERDDYGPHILVDLHTTSAPNGIFSIVSNDPFNQQLATSLYAPVIFNLLNALSSTTNIYIQERGIKGIAFESGQHDDPRSVDLHEAAIWLLLEKMGCINNDAIPELPHFHKRLNRASQSLPAYVTTTYRHEIKPEDEFRMTPGYSNFYKVEKGEVIGYDKRGAVKSPQKGMILMPLYQPQGEEGFFIIEAVRK